MKGKTSQKRGELLTILLCLMPDDFTCQGKCATTQWVNQTICQCILATLEVAIDPDALYFIILLPLMPDNFTLSNTQQFYSSRKECCYSMG
jgi:hypothetical protein